VCTKPIGLVGDAPLRHEIIARFATRPSPERASKRRTQLPSGSEARYLPKHRYLVVDLLDFIQVWLIFGASVGIFLLGND
jgi:hypothetical protein